MLLEQAGSRFGIDLLGHVANLGHGGIERPGTLSLMVVLVLFGVRCAVIRKGVAAT